MHGAGLVENSARSIFNSVAEDNEERNDAEGQATLIESQKLYDFKIMIENNLNTLHATNKRLDEKGISSFNVEFALLGTWNYLGSTIPTFK